MISNWSKSYLIESVTICCFFVTFCPEEITQQKVQTKSLKNWSPCRYGWDFWPESIWKTKHRFPENRRVPKTTCAFLGAKLYFQQNDTRTSSEYCSLVAKLKTYTPRKLTLNLNINQLKRKVIFQTSMFGLKMLIFQVYVQCKKYPTNPSPSCARHRGNAKVEPEHVELVIGHILSCENKKVPQNYPLGN